MSYSQNDEEAVISRLIGSGNSRRFLDIGAHDGVTFSNTRRLADEGWTGTLVEPSPAAFVALMRNYEGRQVNLVHAAVVPAGAQRLLAFHDSHGDMVSTFSDNHRKLWAGRPGHVQALGEAAPATVGFQVIHVAGISVADLVEQYPGPYDVLNLDVEGTNYDLFQALPLERLGVKVACVEYQDRFREITQLALRQGYKIAHKTSENVILQRGV